MRKFAATFLGLLAACSPAQTSAQPLKADAPKLILAISVDQFSADLFDEYRSQFTGGLARLAQGTVFHNGYQAHANTETCPGHSTILTGDHPARTGIISNGWGNWDAPRPDKLVYCAEDERAPGTDSDHYKLSAVHLRVPTLGDMLKKVSPASAASSARRASARADAGPKPCSWLSWCRAGFRPRRNRRSCRLARSTGRPSRW